jgi:hypothetical protein
MGHVQAQSSSRARITRLSGQAGCGEHVGGGDWPAMAGDGQSEAARVTAAQSPWSSREKVRERGGEVVQFDQTGSASLTSGPHLGVIL